jgi:hypothetical protein
MLYSDYQNEFAQRLASLTGHTLIWSSCIYKVPLNPFLGSAHICAL